MSLCLWCSFVCVRQSIFYVCVTCCDLDVTMRRHKKRGAREGEREEKRPLACTIQKKRRNKIRNLWLWLVCCSLLPTCNFHHRPFTSGAAIRIGSREANNIPANNRRASNGHSQTGQRKNYLDEHLNLFCNLCQVLVCPKCTTDGHKDHLWVLLK